MIERMANKITIHNILSYLEGNGKRVLEELKLQPDHIKEQVAYRRLLCKDDCAITGKCAHCGCDFKGKTLVSQSCNNGTRFPNLMSGEDWIKFKEHRGI
jgi:hypothetical protein